MAAKSVWVQDTGTLSCGHLQNPATGRPGARATQTAAALA
jgi:hypothetical protein